MKSLRVIMILMLMVSLVLGGCSSQDVKPPQNDPEKQTETIQESTNAEEQAEESAAIETPTETVSVETGAQEESVDERAVEVDEAILDLGGYTYLTLYLNASMADVVHDFGAPTGSEAAPPMLIYNDFGFFIGTDENVNVVTVTNGEMLDVRTGMRRDELVSVLGEPHEITDSSVGQMYWYYDHDRAITVSLENNAVAMIGYGNYVGSAPAQEAPAPSIGEYIYMTENGLVLRSIDIIENGKYITGIVENISNEVVKSVDISFAFYDASGNTISQDYDYLSTLEPGGTWKYKIVTDDEGTSFKFVSLKSY